MRTYRTENLYKFEPKHLVNWKIDYPYKNSILRKGI